MHTALPVQYLLHLPDFNQTWNFLDRFSIYIKNIRFHENPSSESRVVPCGKTDRHDEANSRFPQFCEGAPKLKPLLLPIGLPPALAFGDFQMSHAR